MLDTGFRRSNLHRSSLCKTYESEHEPFCGVSVVHCLLFTQNMVSERVFGPVHGPKSELLVHLSTARNGPRDFPSIRAAQLLFLERIPSACT